MISIKLQRRFSEMRFCNDLQFSVSSGFPVRMYWPVRTRGMIGRMVQIGSTLDSYFRWYDESERAWIATLTVINGESAGEPDCGGGDGGADQQAEHGVVEEVSGAVGVFDGYDGYESGGQDVVSQ